MFPAELPYLLLVFLLLMVLFLPWIWNRPQRILVAGFAIMAAAICFPVLPVEVDQLNSGLVWNSFLVGLVTLGLLRLATRKKETCGPVEILTLPFLYAITVLPSVNLGFVARVLFA